MILEDQFSLPLLAWYDIHGRKDLPWQLPREPYPVWISEIMLQQTQVQTVIPYFNRFMARFPTVAALAEANEDDVLSLWSGLGYYSRARNIHRTAKLIHDNYTGCFPTELPRLIELPGIGPSTAAAILSQAYNLPTAILDGNVKRVLARFFLVDGPTEQAAVKKRLWELADACMHQERCADYTQAIMDLGATCCTNLKPDCPHCPLKTHCSAYAQGLQHSYPTKKVKKTVPVHQQQLLVLYNEQGLIYLEKRPPTGLWGGLWCLPELAMNLCPQQYILHQYQFIGEKPMPLMAFKHRFSHFHLEINAVRIDTRISSRVIAESNGQWFTRDMLCSLGLAKPTSVILSKLYEEIEVIK